jgi:hypothetical protein
LVSYTWQGKEAKLAVAEMTFDSLGAPARFTYTSLLPSITTGVAGRSGTAPSIHPVPATEGFTVVAGEAGVYRRAELIAMDGKVLATLPFGVGDRLQLSTAGRSPGVYFVRLWPADGDVPVLLRAVVQ